MVSVTPYAVQHSFVPGIYGEGDFLSLEEYDPPFLPPSLLHKKLLTVYAYRYGKGDSARTTWSLTPPAYENSLPCVISGCSALISLSFSQLEEKTRIQRLFKNVVALSEKVAVGPLEYCGNALAFRKPGPHRGDNSVQCVHSPVLTYACAEMREQCRTLHWRPRH